RSTCSSKTKRISFRQKASSASDYRAATTGAMIVGNEVLPCVDRWSPMASGNWRSDFCRLADGHRLLRCCSPLRLANIAREIQFFATDILGHPQCDDGAAWN